IDECRRATAAEPIAGVFISPACEHYDAAAVADAFMRLDPALPLVLAVGSEEEDLTAASTSEGFEDSISLPVREIELVRVLDDLGALDASSPAAATGVPAPRSVVEEIVERAQERAHERVPERIIDRTADRAREATPDRDASRDIAREATPTPPQRAPGVHAAMPEQRALPARTPRTPTAPAFRMPAREARAHDAPSDAPPSDLDLVRAVQDGHDVHGAAMRVLRHHLGSADVRFVAEPRPGEEIAVELDRRGIRQVQVLRADGRPYGTLLSRTIDETCLRAWATWLGTWLDLDEQHQELRRQAWTDELTGAGNRRAFDQVLADTLRLAQRDWRSFGLMLFDIDDFKRYNDHHGHDVGDEVLKEIVELLRVSIRRGDHIFRIGGDEFAVLFCDPDGPRRGGTLDRESATTIANRFQHAVTELSLTHIGLDGPGTVSVSTGFAAFPWHGLDPHSLYRAADACCLESKRAGKNRITFGSGMHGDGAGTA
ncbi:MAG: hypothetical protein RL354_2230, partial [Planctomycetota bacterium]